MAPEITNQIAPKAALDQLLAYCRSEEWAGYDPYDALNSRVFEALPVLNSRLPRIALTQLLKRSPVNVRKLVLIEKTQNPKALGLFLSSFVQLSKEDLADRDELISYMVGRITALRAPESKYWCWGYSFPWQGRKVVVPRGAANLVCTVFAANALLDAYEAQGGAHLLGMAASAADYIQNELFWDDGRTAGFSYPLASLRNQIYNANFLAAALLARVSKLTGDKRFVSPALRVARCSALEQRKDGSWFYGEFESQNWIDNFHTGYNLSGLRSLSRSLDVSEFDENIERGFRFYRENFFREDGAAKYFHNQAYPIDIHCVAQSILTLLEFRDLDAGNVGLAKSVCRWAMENMRDERGFFYYRKLRTCTIKTSYMRWSQAWMALALTEMVRSEKAQSSVMQIASPAAAYARELAAHQA